MFGPNLHRPRILAFAFVHVTNLSLAQLYMHMCAWTCILTFMHAYIHTYIHTYIPDVFAWQKKPILVPEPSTLAAKPNHFYFGPVSLCQRCHCSPSSKKMSKNKYTAWVVNFFVHGVYL